MELEWGAAGRFEAPQMPVIFTAFSLVSFFFFFFFPFHPTSGVCVCVCVCGCRHHLVFKKKSHLVLVFCRHRRQGRNEADTNMRQAGRARGQLGSEHRVCPAKPAAALKRGGRGAGRSASGTATLHV